MESPIIISPVGLIPWEKSKIILELIKEEKTASQLIPFFGFILSSV